MLSDAEIKVLSDKVNAFAPMIESNKPKLGDKGLNVFGAQERLVFLGYKLNISGILDAQTLAAVKLYQKQSKLYPYGILDNSTRNSLNESVVKYVAGLVTDNSDPQLLKAIEVVKTLN